MLPLLDASCLFKNPPRSDTPELVGITQGKDLAFDYSIYTWLMTWIRRLELLSGILNGIEWILSDTFHWLGNSF